MIDCSHSWTQSPGWQIRDAPILYQIVGFFGISSPHFKTIGCGHILKASVSSPYLNKDTSIKYVINYLPEVKRKSQYLPLGKVNFSSTYLPIRRDTVVFQGHRKQLVVLPTCLREGKEKGMLRMSMLSTRMTWNQYTGDCALWLAHMAGTQYKGILGPFASQCSLHMPFPQPSS